MAINPRSALSGRRNFRLSFLETAVVGLLVVGTLFLLTMWVQHVTGAASTTSGGGVVAAKPPVDQLQQALIATDKVQARLTSLEDSVNKLGKDLESVRAGKAPAEKGGGATGLEKRLANLEKAMEAREPAGDARLATRLAAAEERLAALGRLAERLETVERHQAGGAKLEARLEALEKGALAGGNLEARLRTVEQAGAGQARLEERLTALERRPAPAGTAAPSAGDSDLAKRLANLEKRLGELPAAANPRAGDLTALEKRLAAMELLVARLAQNPEDPARSQAALEKRLSRLEQEGLPAAASSGRNPDLERRLANLSMRIDDLGRLVDDLRPPRAGSASAGATGSARLAAIPPAPAATGERPPAERRAPASAVSQGSAAARLKAPAPIQHKVRPGETLFGLAKRYKVKASDILEWNPKLKGRDALWIGETVIIHTDISG